MKSLVLILLMGACVMACSYHGGPPDTHASVTISGPKTGVKDTAYTFTAITSITPATTIYYHWTFDDSIIQSTPTTGSSTVTFRFDTGRHIITVHVLRESDNAHLCSAIDTFVVSDTSHSDHGMDTTSHNFTWTEMSIPTETTINNVWVFASNDMWCSGSEMYHYDGSSWQKVLFKVTGKTYYAAGLGGGTLFGLSDGSFWASYAGIILHFHPETKLCDEYRAAVFGGGNLNACWGTSSTNMYFVGNSGLILHFDGTNWSKMESGTTEDLRSICGTSNTNIWSCGYNSSTGSTVLLHYNGNLWSVDTIDKTVLCQDVWCTTDKSGNPFAVTGAAWMITKQSNNSWARDTTVPNKLPDGSFVGLGFEGNSPTDYFAAGGWGFAAHWNGVSWLRYDQFFAYGAPLYGTDGISVNGNTVCMVGTKGGSSWILLGQRQ